MPYKRLLATFSFILVVISVITFAPIEAQNNLLTDPGFEDTNMKTVAFDQASGTRFSVNVNWNGWYTETPRNADWQNLIPNGTGRNNAGFGFVRSGNRSMELSRGFATFTAAVYQTVTVPENANVTGSAYVVMNINGDNADAANSNARVGIDPTGGTNPLSSNVIWSNTVTNALASNGFRQLTVNATAQGTQVTLFLYAWQTVPTEGNGVFWDDASLTVGGPGGSSPNQTPLGPTNTPVPTAPPVVPFVVPQPTQSDGSIIHTVSEGDTLASISVAYRVSMDDIRELNPSIGEGRFLQIGQQLIIRPPTSSASSSGNSGQVLTPSAPVAPPPAGQGGTPAVAPPPAGQGGNPPVAPPPAGQGGNPTVAPPTAVAQVQQPAVEATPSLRIRSIYYWVNDVTEMRAFYRDLIGLEETAFFDDDSSGLLILQVGDTELIFLEGVDPRPVQTEFARQPNYDGGTLETTSLVLQVPDDQFDMIVATIADSGATIFNNGVLVPQPGQRALYVLDPMGNTIQILAEQ